MNRRAVLPSLYNFVRILLSYYIYMVDVRIAQL